MNYLREFITARHILGALMFIGGLTFGLMHQDKQTKMYAGIIWLSALNLLFLPDTFQSLRKWQYIGTMKIAKAIYMAQGMSIESNSVQFERYPKFFLVVTALIVILALGILDVILYLLLTGRIV